MVRCVKCSPAIASSLLLRNTTCRQRYRTNSRRAVSCGNLDSTIGTKYSDRRSNRGTCRYLFPVEVQRRLSGQRAPPAGPAAECRTALLLSRGSFGPCGVRGEAYYTGRVFVYTGPGDHTGTPSPTATRGKLTAFAQGRFVWGRIGPAGSAGAQRVVLAGGHACHAWTAADRGVLRRLVDAQLLTPPRAASHRLGGQRCTSRKMLQQDARTHRRLRATIGSLGRPYGLSAYLSLGSQGTEAAGRAARPGRGASVGRATRQSRAWQRQEP